MHGRSARLSSDTDVRCDVNISVMNVVTVDFSEDTILMDKKC